ncbi:MAG TPA: alpha/beta fold hydrolase [Burkholderiaceae bacterium]|nr:alpha/beta fold hydrolase [Burkholderiaceae bacterium]
MQLIRRLFLTLAALALASCATPTSTTQPPIVFVHGNGDSAALWMTTLWRFESNGWPRDRLVALNMPYPTARDDDTKPQEGRSSSDEQMRTLAAEVDKVLKATGAAKVVLMGNSRGGNAIRSYIQNGGGAATVSHAILGGTPNHGVWANAAFRPNNEFNGAGPFLSALNAPKGANGDEATPGVAWMTIRSDSNDKYAQPDGVWIGAKGTPTHVTFDGPALKGATNVVLPGRDHREVSYHAEAFAQAYRFITGRAPATSAITPEARVVLDGLVTSTGAGGPTNLPLAGAAVEVYAVDVATGERRGAALLKTSVGADGHWGPLTTDSATPLEFVVSAAGYATHHVYRSAFARSSGIVHLRPERLAEGDRGAAAVVTFVRPRGYFGLPRDQIVFDNHNPAPGIPPGVAGVASSKVALSDATSRTVVGDYKSGALAERVVGRSWPAADNHLVTLELHY